jgi:Bacterial extracellular solute-binding proteins, family 5 Middle
LVVYRLTDQEGTADGPYEVRITTKTRWAPLLADLALFANAVFPEHYLGPSRAQFFQHPIGTGPFAFDRWVKGQYLRLTRNRYTWQAGKPYLNSITYQAVSDANTRVVQLRGGQAQIIEQAPFPLLSSLQSQGFKLGLFPSTRIDYLTMNEQCKPFKDPHVRLAIAEGLDRPAIMKSVFFGHGEVANSPRMLNVTYYSPVGLPAYDLAAARQQMAESRYPHGGLTVDFIAGAGDPVQTPVSQIVAAELKPLGITVKIRQLDPSEVTAQEQSFHFGMRETYWTMDIIDPDEYVSFVLCGSCGSFANWTHFDDPTINTLTGKAEGTFSSSQRAAIYAQIQKRGPSFVASQDSAKPAIDPTCHGREHDLARQRGDPVAAVRGAGVVQRMRRGGGNPCVGFPPGSAGWLLHRRRVDVVEVQLLDPPAAEAVGFDHESRAVGERVSRHERAEKLPSVVRDEARRQHLADPAVVLETESNPGVIGAGVLQDRAKPREDPLGDEVAEFPGRVV